MLLIYSFFLFLQSVKAYNDDRSVDFELHLSEENMMMARQEGILKMLKLTTTIATTNMHLFDENNLIKKYASPEQSKNQIQIVQSVFRLHKRH